MDWIADAHNDLLLEVAYRYGEERPFARHWLPRLRAGGVRLQVCPVSAPFDTLPETALRGVLQQVAACLRAVEECPDDVFLVRACENLDRVEEDGAIGLLLSMEGAEAFGTDAQLVEVFWALGVRMVSLSWNRRTAFADGAAEPPRGGLSDAGADLLGRLAERGFAVDLAHGSEGTFADVLERAPAGRVLVSHAACRALVDTPRNLSDEQLRALAGHGGVLGIMALPLVVGPDEPTLDRLVDHVDRAVDLMGADGVCLGADFIRQVTDSGAIWRTPTAALLPGGMPLSASLDGLAGPDDYPALVTRLRERGYDGDALAGILRGNLVRFLRGVLPGSPSSG